MVKIIVYVCVLLANLTLIINILFVLNSNEHKIWTSNKNYNAD